MKLVAAQAQSLMLARMADWPETEESSDDGENPRKINYSELVWAAVLVAQKLEQTGLAPWIGTNKGSHKNSTEALEFFKEGLERELKAMQEQEEENIITEPPSGIPYEGHEEPLDTLADEVKSSTDELEDNSDEYIEPDPKEYQSPTPLDLGKN